MAASTSTANISAASSATGYEAFIKDSAKMLAAETKDTSSMSAKAPEAKTPEAEEPTATSVADSAAAFAQPIKDETQTMITSHFPAKKSGSVPGLAASSSSDTDKSGTAENKEKGKESKENDKSWTGKMSQYQMDMTCGKLDLECGKNVEDSPRAIPLTEQGEEPPEPWTEGLSDQVQQAQKSVIKSSKGLLYSLGLATKKDQHLMTDYYKAKTVPKQKEEEKSMMQDKAKTVQKPEEEEESMMQDKEKTMPKPEEEEKSMMQDVQDTVSLTTQNVTATVTEMSTTAQLMLGENCDCGQKEEKQSKLTDFDPNYPKPEDAPLTEAAAPAVEAPTATAQETPPVNSIHSEVDSESKKSAPWNPLKQTKNFLSKFKFPKKTSSSGETEKGSVPLEARTCPAPEVEAISWPSANIEVPSFPVPVNMSSLSSLLCNPQKYEEEPTTEDGKEGGAEAEETETPASPKCADVPW